MKYQQAKSLLDRLCDLAILFHASSELRTKMFEALDEHIPHLDQGCFERGCPMDDELSRCPKCGGPADNGHDRSIPPSPYHCTKCEHADELTVAYMMGAQSRLRTLTDELIADLWYKNGTHHHHFARAIERWIKGTDKD